VDSVSSVPFNAGSGIEGSIAGGASTSCSTCSSTLTDSTLRPRPNIASVVISPPREHARDVDAPRAPGILRAPTMDAREDTRDAEIGDVLLAIVGAFDALAARAWV